MLRRVFPPKSGPRARDRTGQAPRISEARRILVPVKGVPMDEEALRLAGGLALHNKGIVYAVHVIEVDRALPLDAPVEADVAHGEDVRVRVEEIARAGKYPVETEVLQARETGPTVVGEALERGVDLVVMGLSYKRPFGEFSLGQVAPHILKNAPCAVWVFREAASPVEPEQ